MADGWPLFRESDTRTLIDRIFAVWRSGTPRVWIPPNIREKAGWGEPPILSPVEIPQFLTRSLLVPEMFPLPSSDRRSQAVSLGDEIELRLPVELSSITPQATAVSTAAGDDLSQFIGRTLDTSFQAARRFAESETAAASSSSLYPSSSLGQKLKLISRMISGDAQTRLFYVEQPGYDTHSAQRLVHERLLRDFSNSLKAFLDDLESRGFADRVAVMAFSEFGRRVEENFSSGTDHGTSGPVFVAGSAVAAGLHGKYPSLSHLEDGDLQVNTDFRRIYATLLTDWLALESQQTLAGSFKSLPLFDRTV